MADDMTLKMRILARGSQALRVIGTLNRGVKKFSAGLDRVGPVSRATFGIAARGASLLLKPMKALAGLSLGLGLMFGTLSYRALGAAGDMQALNLRLKGVSATAEQAKQIFAETSKMSILSPYTPEQLVEARIMLMNVGLTGKAALTAVGDAGSITQRDLVDLVSTVTSLETEPLRRLGIEAKKAGEIYSFTFRDKMQQVQKVTATGVDAARKKMLSIFSVKYGGGMAEFANAWKGATSTLSGLLKMAAADFGDGLMPVATDFVQGMSDKLAALIESGKLKELGAQVADKLMLAWEYGKDVLAYSAEVMKALRKDSEAIPGVLNDGMSTAGQILAVSLVAYLQAAGAVFSGLGHLIAAAFLEEALQMKGMGRQRMTGAIDSLKTMTDEEAAAFKERTGVAVPELARTQAKYTGAKDSGSRLYVRKWLKEIGPENEAALSGVMRQKHLSQGAASFRKKIPETVTTVKLAVAELTKGFSDRTGAAAGMPTFDQFRAGRKADAAAAAHEEKTNPLMANVRLRRFVGSDNTGNRKHKDSTAIAPQGMFEKGEKRAGGTVISIGNLTIRANDAKRMQDEILRYGHQIIMPATT